MRNLILALSLTVAPAVFAGDGGMNADEFDAFTTGRTLNFAVEGQHYGIEEYLPGRRVRWSFLDGRCKDGTWWEEAGAICFAYEGTPEVQCWIMRARGAGLTAIFVSDPPDPTFYEAWETDEPLYCMGPDIGV
jgi:hypothetical protein